MAHVFSDSGVYGGVLPHLLGVGRHLPCIRPGDDGDAAFEDLARCDHRATGCSRVRGSVARAGKLARERQPFAVSHEQRLVVGADGDRRRIPADGDEALDDRDEVASLSRSSFNRLEMSTTITLLLSAFATKSVRPSGEHRDAARGAALQRFGVERGRDDLARAFPEPARRTRRLTQRLELRGRDHMYGVIAGAGDEHPPVGRERHIVGAQADGDVAHPAVGCRVDRR